MDSDTNFLYSTRVLLQIILAWFLRAYVHSHLGYVSYGVDHVTDTLSCYNYCTRSLHKKN
jgi:hypothetical protein